jgi:hypothetical protein
MKIVTGEEFVGERRANNKAGNAQGYAFDTRVID